LLSISAALPGFPIPQSRAPWPVWRGSVAGPVRFTPMSRKEAAKLWHAARKWERETRQPGRHGGIIGRIGLQSYHALGFEFQNFRTGRIDPSLDALARKAICCRRALCTALARLRDLGMITWTRRCEESRNEHGRFRLRQRTNAYVLLPPSQWKGYRKNSPPMPTPDTLGAPERVPDPIEAAVAEIAHGQRMAAISALEADPRDALATALAAFGRAIDERDCRAIDKRESKAITGVHGLPRNTTPDSKDTGAERFAAAEPAPIPPNTDLDAVKAHWIRALLGPDKGS